MTTQKFNPTIDLIKYISAIAVVAIHYTQLLSRYGIEPEMYEVLNFMARFSVPIFFIISGYLFGYKGKSVYINIKSYFLIFGIYTIFIIPLLPKASYGVIWFLSALAVVQLTHIVFKRVKIELMFTAGIVAYVLMTVVMGISIIYTFDYPLLSSISNALLMMPLFSFGIIVKKRGLKILKCSNVILVSAIILLLLNALTVHKSQVNLFQYVMAGVIFLTTYFRFQNVSGKIMAVTGTSFEIYAFHYMFLALLAPYFTSIMSSIDSAMALNAAYIMFFLVSIIVVTAFSIILQKLNVTSNLFR